MGACFQAPHATPRQRQMEMHHVSLIILCISVCFYEKSHRYVQRNMIANIAALMVAIISKISS